VNRHTLLPVLLAVISVAACNAEPQRSGSAENKAEKTYVTGSRIPVRDDSGSASVKTIDNKQGVDDVMQNRGTITNAPKSGGM